MESNLKIKNLGLLITGLSLISLCISFTLIISDISTYGVINYILLPGIFTLICSFLLLRYDNFHIKKYKFLLSLYGINLYIFFFDCIFGALESTNLIIVKLNTLIFLIIFISLLTMYVKYTNCILKNNKKLSLPIFLIIIETTFIIYSTVIMIFSQKNLLLNNILINICNTYYCNTTVNYLFISILKVIPIITLLLSILSTKLLHLKLKIKTNLNLILLVNFVILLSIYLYLFFQ